MAYMNFSGWEGDVVAIPAEATAADVSRFSTVELRVIDFAQRVDATREIEPTGRLGRFIESILGIRLARPLADGKLERLRRFASLARYHRDSIGEDDVKSLIDAGYSPGQAYGLLGYLFAESRKNGAVHG